MIVSTRRLIRAVTILARDGRIPRPLRALVAFGLLPVRARSTKPCWPSTA
jgi:hypothetical protein